MTPDSESIEERLKALMSLLAALAQRASASIPHKAHSWVPGDFQFPRSDTGGSEKDTRQTYLPWEHAARDIDSKRLASVVARGLLEAAYTGGMSVVPSIQERESEFVAVLDASASMLSGAFAMDRVMMESKAASKLAALYFAAGAFFGIACGGVRRFILRTIITHGRRVLDNTTSRRHHDAAITALTRLGGALSQTWREAMKPGYNEPREAVVTGLRQALRSVRIRSVVVVFSDFLDDVTPAVEAALAELTGRGHRVVLADVASPTDLGFFPLPGPNHYETQRALGREGARHLEEGTALQCIDRRTAEDWNDKSKVRRASWVRAARRHSAPIVKFYDLSFAECQARAGACMGHVRKT